MQSLLIETNTTTDTNFCFRAFWIYWCKSGLVQGWESVCWGVGDSLMWKSKVSNVQILWVSWFILVSVVFISKFQSTFESFRKFLNSKDSKLQTTFAVLWEDVAPMLQKSDCMFSGRYWSRVQDFEGFIGRIVGIVRSPSVPKLSKCSIFQHFEISQNSMFRNGSGIFD